MSGGMATPELLVVSPGSFASALAERVELEVAAAIGRHGGCSLALTGGSVGEALFPELLRRQGKRASHRSDALDWSRVEIFWGDERAVPRHDPLSNFKQAYDLWISKSQIPPSNIHPMDPIGGELASCARKYEVVLRQRLAGSLGLDVLLLGVGPDGHVCSLFPQHPVLGEETRWVTEIEDSPKAPRERLTLTLPAIFASHTVIVAASGESKAMALAEAQGGHGSSPLARVLRGSERVVLILDESAASRLSSRD